MKSNKLSLFKNCIPPCFVDFLKKLGRSKYVYFSGNYSCWQKALGATDSYAASGIINKVRDAALMVKQGKAAYERDSVLFDSPDYNWRLVSLLLYISTYNNNKLYLLDFGGALGSSYFQNRDLFQGLSALQWNIVEQSQFVQIGKNEFEDEKLKFYFTIDECLEKNTVNVLLLSSVLQYLESPYGTLERLLEKNIKNIVIDRTGFTRKSEDLLTVQNVPKNIYKASYPAWFLNENRLLEFMKSRHYELKFGFPCEDISNINDTYFKGMFFQYAY